ncbi:hypothetical protein DERP_000158 [Dermatophagoides pteronyssinus]|uniref:Odorant receptor n=1 Tax=Dermatophagoides pteronyssinus TaxID=6956 RepID=A0ABQ8IZE1_DERPT|nr:hypothetical protein DERP_000158 [Dermatophagoides pteronyssinus]
MQSEPPKIRLLFEQFIEVINPFKRLNYLEKYCRSMLELDSITHLTHQVINVYFWLAILRHWLLVIVPWPKEYRIMFFDIVYIVKIESATNALFTLLLLAIKTIENTQYRDPDKHSIKLLYKIMFEHDTSFFHLWINKHCRNPYRPGRTPEKLCKQFRQFVWLAFIFVQGFLLLIDLITIFWHFQLYYLIWQNSHFFFANRFLIPFKLLLAEIMLLSVSGGFYSLVNYLLILVMMGFTSIFSSILRLHQLDEYLEDNLRILSSNDLREFIVAHTGTVNVIARFNKTYSWPGTAYLLSNIPYNVFLVMSMMFHHAEETMLETLILSLMAMQQFVGIFGVHFILTLLPKKIHRNGILRLISLNARAQFRSTITHLKVINYIEKFHCKNRYGVHYYKLNLVTLNTFIKCLILYSKGVIMVYKMFRRSTISLS